MIKSKYKIRVLAGVVMLAAMAVTNLAAAADSYDDNDDILSGTTELLPYDDLYVTFPIKDEDATWRSRQYYLPTDTLSVSETDNTRFEFETNCIPSFQQKSQTLIGRMFATSNDFLAEMRLSSDCSLLQLHIRDVLDSTNNSVRTLFNGAGAVQYAGMAMGDFNLDGYQDIFTMINGNVQAFTAVCTGDPASECTQSPGAGLHPGGARTLPGIFGPYAGAPVVGDFNGDGVVDVAVPVAANTDARIKIFSVCPAAGMEISTLYGKQTCTDSLQIIELTQIDFGNILNLTSKNLSRPTIDIGAGNFDGVIDTNTGLVTDELVVALADEDNANATVSVYSYDAATNAMVFKDSADFDIHHNDDNATQLFIEGAQLDSSTVDYQAVFAWTKKGGSVEYRGQITIITFNETLEMTVSTISLDNSSKTRITGMAVGRYDPSTLQSSGALDFSQ